MGLSEDMFESFLKYQAMLGKPYRGGRYDRWIKVKNRSHPAFSRVMDAFG